MWTAPLICSFALLQIGIQIQKLEPASIGSASAASKHQSILSFTVNKKQSGETEAKGAANSYLHTPSKIGRDSNTTENKIVDQSETSVMPVSFVQSEICAGDKDQSERTRTTVDQSDTGKASENLLEELGR